MKVLLNSFHLNGHTLGFHPQTQKVQKHLLTQGLTLGVTKVFTLLGRGILWPICGNLFHSKVYKSYMSYCVCVCVVRAVLHWVSWNQNQSNYNDQSQQIKKHNEPMRTWSKYTQPKCGKTRVTKSWLVVVVLHLIGWEGGASFLSQSQSIVKQNQSNSAIENRSNWHGVAYYFRTAGYWLGSCWWTVSCECQQWSDNTITCSMETRWTTGEYKPLLWWWWW